MYILRCSQQDKAVPSHSRNSICLMHMLDHNIQSHQQHNERNMTFHQVGMSLLLPSFHYCSFGDAEIKDSSKHRRRGPLQRRSCSWCAMFVNRVWCCQMQSGRRHDRGHGRDHGSVKAAQLIDFTCHEEDFCVLSTENKKKLKFVINNFFYINLIWFKNKICNFFWKKFLLYISSKTFNKTTKLWFKFS